MQTVAQAATPIRGINAGCPNDMLEGQGNVRIDRACWFIFHGLHFHAKHLAGSANRIKLATT